MARLTDGTYSPLTGSLHSGVTGREWSGDIDNITQYGLAFYRTTGGPSGPVIVYIRGGGAANSYTDAKVTGNSAAVGVCEVGYSAPPVWDEYTVICPDMREGGGLWNGGTASSGTDEFGGADVEDILQIYTAFAERYATGDSQRVLWGDSRGGMMAGLALARGLTPDVCILRSPLLDVADYDAFDDSTRATIIADIPGFAGASTDKWSELNQSDQRLLKARSVNLKTDLLPTTTKYLVVWGEDDTTIPRSQCETFVARMRERGAVAEFQVIREFAHAIGANTGTELAFQGIKDFLAKHLT
jgi:acetyl esterase/lipase